MEEREGGREKPVTVGGLNWGGKKNMDRPSIGGYMVEGCPSFHTNERLLAFVTCDRLYASGYSLVIYLELSAEN